MSTPITPQHLAEMQQYYRARASEYDEWFYRRNRYDRDPESNARWFADAALVFAALDAFPLTGDVLELAPGTGIWTERLLRSADRITAVDGAPEMIAINRAKVASDRVEYVQADLFCWQPDRQYDAVFFGFWISHVPLEQLDAFLRSLVTMLKPGGRVFFVDGRREPTSTAIDNQLPELENQIATRSLNNGQQFAIVKNFYDPAELAARCARAGLAIAVRETPTFFIYGYGTAAGEEVKR